MDIDPDALRAARCRSPLPRLLKHDFFSLRPWDIPAVTAVVGNPPFIRYQTFNGKTRINALRCAQEAGVQLPQLSSSWAPFLVHAAAFLQQGGRLGMVAPAELVHAQYAREVLRFILREFGRITVRMFQKKMFPELSEDTILLLCEDYGKSCDWFAVTPAMSVEDVPHAEGCTIPVNIDAIRSGRCRLTHYLLSAKARHLYERMSEEEGVVKLGDAADVGIGYVTGCNDYFHLTTAESKRWGIPSRYLRPAVLSLGDFQGTVFRSADWRQLRDSGKKAYLFSLPASRSDNLPEGVLRYLGYAKQLAVQERFKCRVRNTWYSVPHVRVGDAFLSYMSGPAPNWSPTARNLLLRIPYTSFGLQRDGVGHPLSLAGIPPLPD